MTININKKTLEQLISEVASRVISEAKTTKKTKTKASHSKKVAEKIVSKKDVKKLNQKKSTKVDDKKTPKKKTSSLKESIFASEACPSDLEREDVVGGLPGGEELGEVAPPGWEKTVKKMKKSKRIKNPWRLAWWMHNKGYKPHEVDEALTEMMPLGEENLEDEGLDADMAYSRGNLVNQPMREIGESDVDETAMFFDENERFAEPFEKESEPHEHDLDSLEYHGKADASAAHRENLENEIIDDMLDIVDSIKLHPDVIGAEDVVDNFLDDYGHGILQELDREELIELADEALRIIRQK